MSQLRLSPDHWRQLDKSSNSNNDSAEDEEARIRNGATTSSYHSRYLYPTPTSAGDKSSLFISGEMLRGMRPGANLTRSRRSAEQQQQQRGRREDSVSDALSRNITMILEDLLMDYDKTERPAFKTGQKHTIKY